MPSTELLTLLLLCLGSLIAGFTDAVVGGGGLIQVPLLFILYPQYSHVQVIATNRFASIFGTLVAAVQYARQIGLVLETVVPAGIATTIGSFSGTFIMTQIPTDVYKPLLLGIIMVLTLFTFIKKDFGQIDTVKITNKQRYLYTCIGIGLIIGLYNGTIGPGTGVLLVFALISFLGSDFLKASAAAKSINALADAASLIGFVLHQAIIIKLAVPMMVANVMGSYIGSKMALQRGNTFVRYFFLIIVTLLITRLAWDILKG